MKIIVLNMQGGRGLTKRYLQYLTHFHKSYLPSGQKHLRRAALFLKKEDPDLVLLTEVDERAIRSNFIPHLDILNSLLGHHQIFFPAYKFGGWWHQGNAILSRFPIKRSVIYSLPGKGEPRVMGEAVIEIAGLENSVYVTHLGLRKKNRTLQLNAVRDIWKNKNGPKILGGDLNTADPTEINLVGAEQIVTGKTFPSWKPQKELDYVLLSSEFKILRNYTSPETLLSDHLPLIVETTI